MDVTSRSQRQREAQERIDAQSLLVASLPPGSEDHRRSVKLLLLLQDGLFVLRETEALLASIRRRSAFEQGSTYDPLAQGLLCHCGVGGTPADA